MLTGVKGSALLSISEHCSSHKKVHKLLTKLQLISPCQFQKMVNRVADWVLFTCSVEGAKQIQVMQ